MTPDPRTFAQRASDWICEFCGSWPFMIFFAAFMIVWIGVNVLWIALRFDEYPFILLNLVFTVVELFQGPLIMMSQNRTAERDRKRWREMNDKLDVLMRRRAPIRT
jgi:uncharacterized membrane protein